MNNLTKKLSPVQLVFLQKMFEGGNQQVSATLEMLTQQVIEQLSVRTRVVVEASMRDLASLMHLETDPVASVVSTIRGDFESTFLFLQSNRNFETLGQVMGHALTGTARSRTHPFTLHLQPDWTFEQKHQILDKETMKAQMLDTISEIGNILFGNYLTTFQNDLNLTTYQSVPSTRLVDDPLSLLMQTIPWSSGGAPIAFVNQINCVIRQRKLEAWLLMVPDASGLEKMIDCMEALYPPRPKHAYRPPSIVTPTLSGRQSRPFTGHLLNPRYTS